MELMVIVVVAAVSLLVGFIVGNRFAEVDMELRERRIAHQRRALHEAAAALRARRESTQPSVGAREDQQV